MRAEQSKFLQTLDSTIDDTSSGKDPYDNDDKKDPEESVYDVCSLCHDPNSRVPVSYLILLQVISYDISTFIYSIGFVEAELPLDTWFIATYLLDIYLFPYYYSFKILEFW